jgi:hypothetical protein
VQSADPIFVLCNGRSGSTLLRFILDAHPDLACPPETNIPALCAHLASVWSLIDGAPLALGRGDEPPSVPESAVNGIRATMDMMITSYLQKRGRLRFCDKSLGTARHADLLARIYPRARFISLYRHPMDVISSGIEACPWGLNGYGFDPYIADTPGNAIMAIARFWVDSVAIALAVEEKFPGAIRRIRYEDIVSDPQLACDELFAFLEVPQVPGIADACFASEKERYGPGDHKIWFTSEINADSVGRGWSIPTEMIAPPLLQSMNELCQRLDYVQIDDEWGTTEPPTDLRTDFRAAARGGRGADKLAHAPVAGELLGRLSKAMADLPEDFASRWASHVDEKIVLVSLGGEGTEYMWMEPGTRAIRPGTKADQEVSDWDVVGQQEEWTRVTSRKANLSSAVRASKLRYCDSGNSKAYDMDARLAMLAEILGITR